MKMPIFLRAACVAILLQGGGMTLLAQAVDLLETVQKETAALGESIAERRKAVADAINAAAKSGHLKASTEAYFRDALEKLPTLETISDAERAYFPPRFDTSAEMEPINLAWATLREEYRRAAARAQEMNHRIRNAAAEALVKAVRTGTKPADLDEVDRLLNARRATGIERSSSYYANRDTLNQLSALTRSVLEAAQANNPQAIITAFSRARTFGQLQYETSGVSVPVNAPALMEELRKRVSAPFEEQARSAQRKAEELLIREGDMEEITKTIAEYQAKQSAVERLRESAQGGGVYAAGERSSNVAASYRATLTLQTFLKSNEPQEVPPPPPALSTEGASAVSPEFQAYVARLNRRSSEHHRKMRKELEVERERAEQARRVELERKQIEAVAEATKAHRAKFNTVRTAEEALALADELSARQRHEQGLINWQGVAAELQSIARWWLDGTLPAPASGDVYAAENYGRAHPFIAEIRSLRERAARDVATRTMKLPELGQPGYAELKLSDALHKLANEAARRSDWKQSFSVLQLLSQVESNSSTAFLERLAAVRSFLVAGNLEAAGQTQQAAFAYLDVIRAVGDHLPTREAGERLKALQKDDPELSKALKDAPAAPRPLGSAELLRSASGVR